MYTRRASSSSSALITMLLFVSIIIISGSTQMVRALQPAAPFRTIGDDHHHQQQQYHSGCMVAESERVHLLHMETSNIPVGLVNRVNHALNEAVSLTGDVFSIGFVGVGMVFNPLWELVGISIQFTPILFRQMLGIAKWVEEWKKARQMATNATASSDRQENAIANNSTACATMRYFTLKKERCQALARMFTNNMIDVCDEVYQEDANFLMVSWLTNGWTQLYNDRFYGSIIAPKIDNETAAAVSSSRSSRNRTIGQTLWSPIKFVSKKTRVYTRNLTRLRQKVISTGRAPIRFATKKVRAHTEKQFTEQSLQIATVLALMTEDDVDIFRGDEGERRRHAVFQAVKLIRMVRKDKMMMKESVDAIIDMALDTINYILQTARYQLYVAKPLTETAEIFNAMKVQFHGRIPPYLDRHQDLCAIATAASYNCSLVCTVLEEISMLSSPDQAELFNLHAVQLNHARASKRPVGFVAKAWNVVKASSNQGRILATIVFTTLDLAIFPGIGSIGNVLCYGPHMLRDVLGVSRIVRSWNKVYLATTAMQHSNQTVASPQKMNLKAIEECKALTRMFDNYLHEMCSLTFIDDVHFMIISSLVNGFTNVFTRLLDRFIDASSTDTLTEFVNGLGHGQEGNEHRLNGRPQAGVGNILLRLAIWSTEYVVKPLAKRISRTWWAAHEQRKDVKSAVLTASAIAELIGHDKLLGSVPDDVLDRVDFDRLTKSAREHVLSITSSSSYTTNTTDVAKMKWNDLNHHEKIARLANMNLELLRARASLYEARRQTVFQTEHGFSFDATLEKFQDQVKLAETIVGHLEDTAMYEGVKYLFQHSENDVSIKRASAVVEEKAREANTAAEIVQTLQTKVDDAYQKQEDAKVAASMQEKVMTLAEDALETAKNQAKALQPAHEYKQAETKEAEDRLRRLEDELQAAAHEFTKLTTAADEEIDNYVRLHNEATEAHTKATELQTALRSAIIELAEKQVDIAKDALAEKQTESDQAESKLTTHSLSNVLPSYRPWRDTPVGFVAARNIKEQLKEAKRAYNAANDKLANAILEASHDPRGLASTN